jgi:small subunit ribosomal protein S9
LIQDETPEQPTDETPTPDEENVEPTTAPDEAPAEAAAEDVPSAESPADAPAEGDDITEVAEEAPPQPDQAEGEDAEAAAPAEAEAPVPAEAEAEAPVPAEAEAAAPAEAQERPRPKKDAKKSDEPEVIPGAHLEPDLVLDQPSGEGEGDEYSQYAATEDGDEDSEAPSSDAETTPVRSPLELAADARYQATGKRKTAIARVILKPGSGVYTINGKTLEVYFPRERLQTQARQPLDATGNLARMDVVARIHGGGVSAQAGALRHGIARALVEAEPTLRTELKRRGYLTRDPREKERKKAGLKKARKRPQFSKR